MVRSPASRDGRHLDRDGQTRQRWPEHSALVASCKCVAVPYDGGAKGGSGREPASSRRLSPDPEEEDDHAEEDDRGHQPPGY